MFVATPRVTLLVLWVLDAFHYINGDFLRKELEHCRCTRLHSFQHAKDTQRLSLYA